MRAVVANCLRADEAVMSSAIEPFSINGALGAPFGFSQWRVNGAMAHISTAGRK